MDMPATFLKTGLMVLLAGAALAGCVVSPDMIYPIGRMAPVDPALVAGPDAAPDQAIRTVKSGEILFSQAARNAAIVVLENAVTPATDINMGVAERSIEISPGMRFYAGVNVGSETATVACSFTRPVQITPRLNPGNKGTAKFCFRMDDLPEGAKLDSLPPLTKLSSSTFFVVTENFNQQSGPSGSFQSMMRWEPNLFTYKTVEPARFRPATDTELTDIATTEIALRYKSTTDGGELEAVYIANGSPQPLESKTVAFAATDRFPRTVHVRGAEVELLALTNGVLAYRLRAGFSPDRAFILDLPQ